MALSSFQHYFYCLERLGLAERTGRNLLPCLILRIEYSGG
jgi:hypothetical protein